MSASATHAAPPPHRTQPSNMMADSEAEQSPPSALASIDAASSPFPSRSAAYRLRKAAGDAIRPRRTSAQLDALEATPPDQRTPADNRALRDRRKNTHRRQQQQQQQQQQQEEEPTPSTSPVNAQDPLSISLPDATCHASASTDTSHADALPLSSSAAELTDLAVTSAPPRLVSCAVRFVHRQARGTRCLPFSCTEEQLPLLLQAVEQRVHADSAAAAAAAAIPALCSSDQQLVRSLMTQLQQWPDMIQQLWEAMSARKLSKEKIGQLHEKAALHDYVRDVALQHRPPIGCETAHPDRVANVVSSMRVNSAMDEFAFSPTLRHLIDHAPGVPILHVPPQLVVAWHGSASSQAGSACPMAEWLRSHLAQLLETRYFALHWSDAHFCSIIVDMHVWRAGPGGVTAAAAASSASSGSVLSAQHGLEPAPAMDANKRQRCASSALRAATEDARSTVRAAVPLLHLDTLPSACRFTADKYTLLRRICSELNSLCGTTWPIHRQCDLQAHLHLCGPTQQPDKWSCGYRLLHAWKRILDTARSAEALAASSSLTPSTLNSACDKWLESNAAMVERVCEWQSASAMRAEDIAVDPRPIVHPPISLPTCSAGAAGAIDRS